MPRALAVTRLCLTLRARHGYSDAINLRRLGYPESMPYRKTPHGDYGRRTLAHLLALCLRTLLVGGAILFSSAVMGVYGLQG